MMKKYGTSLPQMMNGTDGVDFGSMGFQSEKDLVDRFQKDTSKVLKKEQKKMEEFK